MARTKSRMLKIQCSGCGAILYGSKQSLRKALYGEPFPEIGGMKCGCGGWFSLAHQEDRQKIENTTEREA